MLSTPVNGSRVGLLERNYPPPYYSFPKLSHHLANSMFIFDCRGSSAVEIPVKYKCDSKVVKCFLKLRAPPLISSLQEENCSGRIVTHHWQEIWFLPFNFQIPFVLSGVIYHIPTFDAQSMALVHVEDCSSPQSNCAFINTFINTVCATSINSFVPAICL